MSLSDAERSFSYWTLLHGQYIKNTAHIAYETNYNDLGITFQGLLTSGRHTTNADATGVLPLLWKSATGLPRSFSTTVGPTFMSVHLNLSEILDCLTSHTVVTQSSSS